MCIRDSTTKKAIIEHVSKGGTIKFGEKSTAVRELAEKRISEVLALIASSKEYQRG